MNISERLSIERIDDSAIVIINSFVYNIRKEKNEIDIRSKYAKYNK